MGPAEQVSGKLSSLVASPVEKPKKALILLHGVGSNEENLLGIGQIIAKDRLVISLRAPLTSGPRAFAWFQVQFGPEGPVHNQEQASAAFKLIEDAIKDISVKTGIAPENMSILGFSQGAILTIGLALQSKLRLESYMASSGRTLPEFAKAGSFLPPSEMRKRRVFLSHGVQDSVLSVNLSRNSKVVLHTAGADVTHKEYDTGHTISEEQLVDLKKWMTSL